MATKAAVAAARPLLGKLAIVTGASQGIGEAIATHLARKGSNIVLNYTSPKSTSLTQSLAQKLQAEHGVRTLVVQADMGSVDGPSQLVEATREAFSSSSSSSSSSSASSQQQPSTNADGKGENAKQTFQIDILINNAGVALNGSLAQLPLDTMLSYFDTSYNVNVRGPLLLTRSLLPYLPHDRSGRIVNLSSVSSSLGFIKQSIYGGTKAALEAMTRTWARELAERATVNAINPGPVLTRMYYEGNDDEFIDKIRPFIEHTPLMRARDGVDEERVVRAARKEGGRPAYVDEIAGMVGLLVSEEAGWCTGQVVCANGGMVMLH